MKLSPSQALMATVSYADVFDYPLTEIEIKKWLIGRRLLPAKSLKQLSVIDAGGDRFVVLPGRKFLVNKRIKRRLWSGQKWIIAKRAASYLKKIPTVQLVGVTGALAMDNAKEDDDIDLFFIVTPGALWTSRLLILATVELLGIRRRRDDKVIKDKICLNMFMTADSLALPAGERDLFSAHEVLQMKPLWDRGGAYQKFLQANAWVKEYLPNAWKEKVSFCHPRSNRGSSVLFRMDSRLRGNDSNIALRLFELPAKIIQLSYMSSRRTTEVVESNYVRFHPHDARVWVREQLAGRLARFRIPLDNIFYGR